MCKNSLAKLIIVGTLTLFSATATAASADLPRGIQIVLDRYFAALETGDTNDLSHLYGGNLERNRASMRFDNEHADNLKQRYENSAITVLSQTQMSEDYYTVHYRVEKNGEVMEKMLYLTSSKNGQGPAYKIVKEVLVP